MMNFLSKFFGKKEEEVQDLPKSYKISEKELAWLAKKVIRNKKLYIRYSSEDKWLDFATLHFIVNRLNYERLDKLVPRELFLYENHYYYKAGMILKQRVEELLNK